MKRSLKPIKKNSQIRAALIISGFCILLSSCAFNKLFLYPDHLAKETKEVKFVSRKTADTTSIKFGAGYSPTYLNSEKDTIDFPYSIESVLLDNTNGNLLNGWFYSPDSNYNGTVVLFLHGNAGNLISQASGPAALAKRGYKVLIVDYSGFGFSEGEATRKNVLIDANAALDYLIKRESKTAKRVLIYGQSLGGHLAATVASRNQDKIDGLVLEGAFSSHNDIAADMMGVFGWLGRISTAEQYSGKRSIQTYKKPLLVIHSREDKTVPYQHGIKLFEKGNEPKSFYQIDSCHICGPVYYADSIAFKMNQMFTTAEN
jgi:dienelactone hydrolase